MKKIKFNVLTFVAVIAGMMVFTGCPPPPPPITLSVDPTSLTFSAINPQEQLVAIKTNANSWAYQVTDSWVSASQEGDNLKVSTQDNTSPTVTRTAKITVTAGDAPSVTISVTQPPRPPYKLSVNETSLTFTAAAGSKSVTVTTDAASWNATADKEWVTPTKSGNTLTINVLANTTTSDRISVVTVTAGDANPVTLAVTQAKPDLFITLSPTSYTFGSAAGTTSVTVSSNVSWTASSDATSWLTVSPASGTNNGSLTLTVKANTSTSARSATITVTGSDIKKTCLITQQGVTPTKSPQVRFRKLSNNNNLYTMGIVNSDASDVLAFYQFNASTGTSAYSTIPAGNHYTIVLFGNAGDGAVITWSNADGTYTFKNDYQYTFEYDGTDYWMRPELNSAPEKEQMQLNGAAESIKGTKSSIKLPSQIFKIK